MANRRELDEWDPMTGDFIDGSFNTYVDGPGARLDHSLQPWARPNRSKGPYKIHVANIPTGITQEGLFNIFSRCGEVLSVYKHEPLPGQHSSWAFVMYPKHSQAELAIREFHNKQPLFLKVQFAMSETERQRVREEREKAAIWGTVSQSLVDSDDVGLMTETRLKRKSGVGVGRGKFRQVFLQDHSTPLVGYRRRNLDDDYSDEECLGSSVRGQFDEVNGVLLKGIHCSLQSGGSSRTVSKGRGFYNVSMDRPGMKRQSQLHSPDHLDNSSDDIDFAVTRQSGKYVYGDPVHLRAGDCRACLACGRLTTSVCARCGDFYCSEECQRNDWPNHKPNCVPPPGIVNTANGVSPNRTLPHYSPPTVAGKKDTHCVIERRENMGDENEPSENPLLSVTNNYSVSAPRNAHDINKPDRERSDSKPLLPLGRNALGNEDTKQKKRTNTEVSGSVIPPLLGSNDIGKQSSTLHDRIQNNFMQGEMKPSGNHSGASAEKYQKRNSRGNQTSTSPTFGETSRSHISENQNRNRNTYGQNESGKRSNNHNQGNRNSYGQDEMGRRQNDHSQAGRNSYGRNETSRRGNDHIQGNHNSYGQNEDSRRHNDHKQGNWKQGGDKGADKNKIQNKSGNQRNNKLSNQHKSSNSNERGDFRRQNKDVETHQLKSADEKLVQSVEEKLIIRCPSKSPEESAQSVEHRSDGKTSQSLDKEEISTEIYQKVKIVLKLDSRQYVVQKVEHEAKIMEVLQLLQNCGDSEVFTPEVGKLCVALYEGIWYRAQIIQVIPQLRVYYLDYGNEETCTADTLRSLPKEASELSAQAIKIKLADGTSKKFENLCEDDEIMIKSLKKDSCGATIVMVEGENYAQAEVTGSQQSETKSPSKVWPATNKTKKSQAVYSEASVLSLLSNGTEGAMCVRAIENPNQFTGTFVAESCVDKYKKIFEGLCFEKGSCDSGFKPTVGEYVAAQLPVDSLWYRAKILSLLKNGYKVALSDLGISQKVENVRRLPEGYCNIEQLSVRCKIVKYVMTESDIWRTYIKIGQNLKLTVADACPTKVIAHVVDDDIICTIEMIKWNPIPEDRGLKIVELQNNSSVILSTFCSPRTMFVRPYNKNTQEKFNRLLQDVAGHAFKAPALDRLPVIGEILACRYKKDNNYYRAKVVGFEKDKVMVIYIDFGNTEHEDLCSVKELSEELKNVPACVVKVNLKDIPDLPLNTQIVEFLSEITLKETELKVKFGDLKEGVDLFMDGTHLNSKLKFFLEPSWQQDKKNDSDSGLYFYEHLKYVDLPIGEEISLAICHAQAPDIVFGFKEGSDVMQYIMTVMQEKVDEYCNKVDKESFLPRKYEMCLAEYEGAWYRAACLEPMDSNLVLVVFVDYGNTEEISFKKIRRMPRDFMESPVAVVACAVKDFSKAGAEGDMLQEFVNTVKKVKVLSTTEKGHFDIEIIQ